MREPSERVRRARELAAGLILLAALGRLVQLAGEPSQAVPAPAPRRVRIDPSRAPAEVLQLLPGIGPSKARAIVANREREGSFLGLEELLRVPGIGPVTLEGLRPYLLEPGSATAPAGR